MFVEVNASYGSSDNPLDNIESVLYANDWAFTRPSQDELILTTTGKNMDYRILMYWEEDNQSIQFSCEFDLCIPHKSLLLACEALQEMNTRLWLGHFDLAPGNVPTYRYTSMLKGISSMAAAEQIGEIVDIALTECERYMPAFYLMANNDVCTREMIDFALMESPAQIAA